MADIALVIKIPEGVMEYIKNNDCLAVGYIDEVAKAIKNGKPLNESFEWCTDCKEYDHEKHCCPRWTKVIRTTLNDNINAVLDEIRAEIEPKCDRINTLASELSYPEHREIQELLCEIMDLCKAESEVEE